ncbi:MAG: hypothetical protein GY742_01515 [Hyphomicrobiales bacterium]|nr:hypothetical protein [Hyphomicrobiales bacterium]
MKKEINTNQAELVAYTSKLLNSLRLPPPELPKNNKRLKMRGEYFYGKRFPKVLLGNLRAYQGFFECLPDFPLECETLNEKLFWSKFFTPLDIPTPADKLTVGNFIPGHLRDKVRPAKVHWISDRPDFPDQINGPDGSYFLKANNSWRTVKRINFPMAADEIEELRHLGSIWLGKKNFNLMGGEWWYSTINPKIYIEEDVTDGGNSCAEYKFQCIGGEVVCIFQEYYVSGSARKEYEGVGIYNKDFEWVEGVEIGELKNIKADPPPDSKMLLEVAREIAKPFDAIRVDLYNPKPKTIILGELTICDAAGFAQFEPRSFDAELGSSWDFTQYFA